MGSASYSISDKVTYKLSYPGQLKILLFLFHQHSYFQVLFVFLLYPTNCWAKVSGQQKENILLGCLSRTLLNLKRPRWATIRLFCFQVILPVDQVGFQMFRFNSFLLFILVISYSFQTMQLKVLKLGQSRCNWGQDRMHFFQSTTTPDWHTYK